ncbi:MAG: PKD domain-containing protein [Thermoanaerobaculia bacterium]|nr:PKD domain-containing protein [Thermoanaerobaculia bacterium]
MRIPRYLFALAALFVLATCDKATPVAPSDGTLQISANPTKIDIFGISEITIIGRKADGNPVNEGTEITLSTTAGTLSATTIIANDRGVATANLTGTGAVEVATITASSGGAAPVTVDVEIGSLASSITLQATPTRIRRAGDSVRLVATVRDEDGNTVFRARVTFETDGGRLRSQGEVVETDPQGKAEDRLSFNQSDIDDLDSSTVLVSASVSTAGGALLFADQEISVAGVPFEILLAVSPATVDENGGQVTLTAVVADDNGKGVEDEGVIFSTDVGSLASGGRQVLTDRRGEAQDVLTVTANDLGTFDPGQSFTVGARTLNLAEVTDAVQVIGPPDDPAGQPAQVFLTTNPRTLPGTGGSTELRALVLDSDGVPVPAAPLIFSAEAGQLDSGGGLLETDANGEATDTLVASESDLLPQTDNAVTVSAQSPGGINPTASEDVDIIRPPKADFSFTVNATTKVVTFTNRSTGTGLTFFWDFGDGASSTSSSLTVTHTYASGSFTAQLTAQNALGSDTFSDTIVVP